MMDIITSILNKSARAIRISVSRRIAEKKSFTSEPKIQAHNTKDMNLTTNTVTIDNSTMLVNDLIYLGFKNTNSF